MIVKSEGYAVGDTFSFDTSGTSAEGGAPFELVNGGNTVCLNFTEVSSNVFTGSFVEAVDTSLASSLVVGFNREREVTVPVVF